MIALVPASYKCVNDCSINFLSLFFCPFWTNRSFGMRGCELVCLLICCAPIVVVCLVPGQGTIQTPFNLSHVPQSIQSIHIDGSSVHPCRVDHQCEIRTLRAGLVSLQIPIMFIEYCHCDIFVIVIFTVCTITFSCRWEFRDYYMFPQ